jgi:hypothetical protein
MTREHRELITIDDIESFEFLCGNKGCGARITLRCNGGLEVPSKCPHCGHPWLEQTKDADNPYGVVQLFAQYLSNLRRLRGIMGCTLRLEIKPEPITPGEGNR